MHVVFIGQCQADVPVITALLLFGEYQTGSRYYFYSTYGSNKNRHTHTYTIIVQFLFRN